MATIKTNIEPADQKVLLPFHDFVILLRQHGFSIKPEDYIELLKVVETFGPQNALEGAPLICPLIATSPEEQDRFYKIVEEYKVQTEDKKPPTFRKKLQWWWKQNRRWVLGGFILLAAAVVAYFIFHKTQKPLSAVLVYDKKGGGDRKYRVGDTAELNGALSLALQPEALKNVQFFWNTGNGFRQDSPVIRLPLTREGDQTVELKIRSAVYPIKDSITAATFPVCPGAPRLQLPLNKDDFNVQDELIITPAYASDQRFQNVYWRVNDSVVQAEEGTGALRYTFDSSGIYTVRFIGLLNKGDDENTPCTYIQTLENIAVNDDRYALRTQYSGQNITAFNKNLNPLLNWMLLLPALLIGIGTWLWWKKKKKPEPAKKEEAPAAKGQKPPYETPFENKDLKLTEPEHAFREVFRSFRQKAEDETTTFNVPKSIQQTIRSGGLPEMVFTHRMRYNDYVILIDRSLAKSMQVHLFDYLVKLFNEEAICVERFYYTGNFDKIFNENVPGGMSLKRLSELYKTYTLIIMGHARQLAYPAYPVLDKNLADTLNEWEYKAILTPVPYKDWEDKEALIAKKLILLPADLQGQLKLIQAVREKQLDHKKYLSSIRDFYETTYYDFMAVEDLKTYLDDDVLFQWLCAVAVFHKLRWEVVIEVGKAVCTKYKAPEKMNFTNLLKLSRISWMNEGAFPAAIRLELLKALEPANELVARETLLRMMQYTDTYFGDDYFFQQEKEVQQVTSRFLLYAHDPEQFAGYEADQLKFKALWEGDKLWDTPQKVYLENPDQRWSTILQHKDKSIGINRYFQKEKTKGLRSEQKTVWRNGLMAASLIVLLGLLHLIKNVLPYDSLLLKAAPSEGAMFRFVVNNRIPCDNNGSLTSVTGTLHTGDGIDYSFPFGKYNDTAFAADVQVPVSSISNSNAYLEISWNNGRPATATSLVSLRKNVIEASISACSLLPEYTVNIVYNDSLRENEVKELADFLSGQGYTVKNTTYEKADSSTAVYFFTAADKAGADSLARLLSFQLKDKYPAGIPPLLDTTLDFGQKKTLGLFLNFTGQTPDGSADWSTAILSSSLNEIWQGGTSNRLLTINSPLIYYSTGDKRTYGTYRMDEVLRNPSGTYKVITRAGEQYAVFFIRNVQRNGFELSVCQNRYSTKEEALTLDESYCDRFNQMTLYYETDPAKIFLPLNPSNAITPSSQQKLKQLNAAIVDAKNKGYNASVLGRLFYNSRFKREIPGTLPIRITQTIQIPNETPFDRSYVQYTINTSSLAVAMAPDCNRVFRSIEETKKLSSPLMVCRLNLSGQNFKTLPKEIFEFKNLQELDIQKTSVSEKELEQLRASFPKARILFDAVPDYQQNAPVQNNAGITTPERLLSRVNLDEKGYPDNEAQAILNQVVNYTQQNNNAKVRIVFYYGDNNALKAVQDWMAYLDKYLNSLKHNSYQFELETKKLPVQKRVSTPNNDSGLAYYADVFGTNFPANFLRGATAN